MASKGKNPGGREYLAGKLRECGLSRRQAVRIVDAVLAEMKKALRRGREVEFADHPVNRIGELPPWNFTAIAQPATQAAWPLKYRSLKRPLENKWTLGCSRSSLPHFRKLLQMETQNAYGVLGHPRRLYGSLPHPERRCNDHKKMPRELPMTTRAAKRPGRDC